MRLGDNLGEKVDVFLELGRVSETKERTEGDFLTISVLIFILLGLNFLAGDLTFVGEAFFLFYIWLILEVEVAVCS